MVTLTKNSNISEEIVKITGSAARYQKQRIAKLEDFLKRYSAVELHKCADEQTGQRFGNAHCRSGRAFKIGYTTNRYQLWVVTPIDSTNK
tara:strand:+ start:313 stop:582 length:270 start_codon:yes stop_codon:yes gene_type:complete